MPSAIKSSNDRNKVTSLQEYAPELYGNIDLDHLAVFAVGRLYELGVDLSFENAVVACFRLFPKKFALSGYPIYPDSDRIRNCLNRCTRPSKKWLGGKALHGFEFSEATPMIIKETESYLSGRSAKQNKATSQTRRKESLVAELKNSPVFKKYKEGRLDEISEADMCFALQGTLDTARDVLRNNLRTLQLYCDEIQEREAAEFLNWLEKRFHQYLNYKES